jgi:hypothetical protein
VTWVKWKLALVCLEMLLILAQDRCIVAPNVPRAWKLVLVHFAIVLTLMQHRCTVCTERAIHKKMVLGAPDGTPR